MIKVGVLPIYGIQNYDKNLLFKLKYPNVLVLLYLWEPSFYLKFQFWIFFSSKVFIKTGILTAKFFSTKNKCLWIGEFTNLFY